MHPHQSDVTPQQLLFNSSSEVDVIEENKEQDQQQQVRDGSNSSSVNPSSVDVADNPFSIGNTVNNSMQSCSNSVDWNRIEKSGPENSIPLANSLLDRSRLSSMQHRHEFFGSAMFR